MADEPVLAGKTALVTGASRGLGAEIALRLAAAGAHVAMAGRDAAVLRQSGQQVADARASAAQRIGCNYVFDLADPRQVDRMGDAVLRDFGVVDVLVNNAAIQGPIGPFEQIALHDWRPVFEINLFAPLRLIQLVLPGMKARGRGKIINLSGGGAASPRPDFTAYGASKTALVRMTETLAVELKKHCIDINAIAPGALNTRMLEQTLAAGHASREFEAAMKRSQSGGDPPAKAADLVVWLASNASDGITGRLISAVWDDWQTLASHKDELEGSDVYTLRRIVPADRGMNW